MWTIIICSQILLINFYILNIICGSIRIDTSRYTDICSNKTCPPTNMMSSKQVDATTSFGNLIFICRFDGWKKLLRITNMICCSMYQDKDFRFRQIK
jgi:hypothetical protein